MTLEQLTQQCINLMRQGVAPNANVVIYNNYYDNITELSDVQHEDYYGKGYKLIILMP
jgi:hypothetical protein